MRSLPTSEGSGRAIRLRRPSRHPPGKEIYVLVIGESSRPQNWSLFGYPRDTTPRLRQTPGVVPLSDMLTTAPHTAVAVPSMVSLEPIERWSSIVAEKSIVQAFNEVGFKTYWLSAQAADSWAGLIPQIAAEATRRRYFDSGYDGAMLPELRAILADATADEKVFIVLHTKGSHFSTRAATRPSSRASRRATRIVGSDWWTSTTTRSSTPTGS